MNTRLFHLGKLNQTVDCVELGLRSAEISAEIEISLPKNQPLPKLTKICYLPPRMLEAIIRSFPDRVLTVTVLAPHKSGQKRALSFDSCLPPEPAKRACNDETAPLVRPTAARRATPMLSASTLTHLIVNNALRRNFDAAAIPPPGLLPERLPIPISDRTRVLTALPPLGLLPEPAALPPLGL